MRNRYESLGLVAFCLALLSSGCTSGAQRRGRLADVEEHDVPAAPVKPPFEICRDTPAAPAPAKTPIATPSEMTPVEPTGPIACD